MRKLLLALPLLAGAVACSKDADAPSKDRLLFNDFESMAGWTNDSPSLTKEVAHSGAYSIKVDKDNEYSLTYRNVLGKIVATKPKKLRLTAWAYLPNTNTDAKLTLQVQQSPQDGATVFNEAIALKEVARKTNEWVKVEKEFTLPDNVTATNQIVIYVWRGGSGEPAYVDDLELSVAE